MTFEEKNDREPRAGDYTVKPKRSVSKHLLGLQHNNAYDRVQQDILIWRRGYERGLQEGRLQSESNPAPREPNRRNLGNWHVAGSAHKESLRRFWPDNRWAK